MSDYLLRCDDIPNAEPSCTMIPYTTPPATIDHYALGPTWGLWLAAGLIVLVIIAVAVVRYKAHTERADTERQRILHPPKQCPTCGYKMETA
jgi:hypothetical protein